MMYHLRSTAFNTLRHYSKDTKIFSDKILSESHQATSPLNFVLGKRVDAQGSSSFQLIAPATGKVLRNIPNSNEQDISEAVLAARHTFKSWSKWTGFERGKVLKTAAELIRNKVDDLAYTEVLDTGKPIWEARYDILGCADTIEYYGGLAGGIKGDFMQLSGGSFAYTVREPLGVVGGIGAWNFPFQMAAWKSAPALACGNTMVFKPSQVTPLTAVMLGEIYQRAGLPGGCYNVVQGEGETGQILCSHSDIDKVTFTGSVPTGSRIMETCAKGIKHVTLELGGKSPLIIFSDADLDNAVKGAILANFSNQGQVCSNGTRVFVEESIAEDFLAKLIERVDNMKIGDPYHEDTTVGATISSQQAQIVEGYIDNAKKEGATVVYGGERVTPSDPNLAGGIYLRPCILVNCTDDMTVVRKEVFGPVLSLLTFKSEEEVVARANDTEFGLAGGVFTRDLQRAHRVVAAMEAGSIYVNNYNVYPVGVPFGGYKKSGIGRENGEDSLNYYSQIKSVYFEGGDVECPY
ncbi:betaine aldehyde dehydrogenase [Plakobranchus ocellatus]|uniref:Betaine aldehyde dehydrogenase n=1 Tax=Plakobranchus ocellatus TaxID=259542 RepID=A0AAV3YKA3_9GAST|nr:betaine aldehyde dehydrogenase [Plakobranchus ocellatus]